MKTPNIDSLLHMTRQYLDGEVDRVDYCLDFPYEFEKRYAKACKEH